MNVEKGVDEALRQLPTYAERLLRMRYGIGAPTHAQTNRPQLRRVEAAALRRLRLSALSPHLQTH